MTCIAASATPPRRRSSSKRSSVRSSDRSAARTLGRLGGDRGAETRVILDKINHSTLGSLIKRLQAETDGLEYASDDLAKALEERNRLSHHFYGQHDNRRNSEDGRAIMGRS